MADEIITQAERSGLGKADFYYWRYQYELGRDIIVPYFQNNICEIKDKKIVEIGSAEGGVLHSFVRAGASYGLGTDIAENRLESGRKVSAATQLNVEFTSHNIITDEIPQKWQNYFDIVILRDVIEHLPEPELAILKIRELLRDEGFLYVTFPPYRSPYGGHQHTLAGNFLTKLPYIHLFPDFIFRKMISSGRQIDQEETLRLRKIRLSSKKFKECVYSAGYKIAKEAYFLLRPVFKKKFGLPTVKIGAIGKIPFLGDFLSLECMYVLKK